MDQIITQQEADIILSVCKPYHWIMPFQGYGEVIDAPIIANGWSIEPVWMMDPRIPFWVRERIVALRHGGIRDKQIWYGHPDVPDPVKKEIKAPQVSMPWKEIDAAMAIAIKSIAAITGAILLATIYAVLRDPAVFILTSEGSIYLVASWEE